MWRVFAVLLVLSLVSLPAYAQCTNPSGSTGDMIFNDDHSVFQGCTSGGWEAFQVPGGSGLSDGLVGHWTLDETTGTTFVDSINGNDVSVQAGGLTAANDSIPGAIGTGIDFDGINDHVGTTAATPELVDIWNGGGSVAFWIYPEEDNSEIIIAKTQWTIRQRSGQASESGLWFIRQFSGGSATWRDPDTTPDIPLNQWSHIVFAYNDDSVANDPIVYINGQLASSLPEIVAPTGGYSTDIANDFSVGSSSAGASNFDGGLDDIRMYNRIISPLEAEALYSMGRGATGCENLGDATYYRAANGHCYWRNPATTDHATRKSECEADNGFLAAAESAAENTDIFTNLLSGAGVTLAYMAGLRAASDPSFVYDHGPSTGATFYTGDYTGTTWDGTGQSLMYTAWRAGEPTSALNLEQCMFMFDTVADWGDGGCTSAFPYICERGSCINPHGSKGDIVYNDDEGVFQGCIGGRWEAFHEPPYVPNAVDFDGTSDFLELTGDLAGITNSKSLTYSYWIKADDSFATTAMILRKFGGGGTVRFGHSNSGRFFIEGQNGSATLILRFGDTTSDAYDGAWHHVMCSLDLSDVAKRHCYFDDVYISATGWTTYTDDFLDLDGAIEVEIGANGGGRTDAEIADVWVDFGTYIDLSDADNRAKFIDTDGNPVYLGADGSRPFGTVPDVFLSGETASWHTNKGSGGGFTEYGALTDAPSSPINAATDPLITDGLLAHWTMDDTSGITLTESINGKDGVFYLTGSSSDVVSGKGIYGKSLRFNGDDNYVRVWDTVGFDNMWDGGGSVSLWVKPGENFNGEIQPPFVSKTSMWNINTRYTNPGETGLNFFISFSGTNGVWRNSPTIPPITIGEWHHMVVTYDSDSTGNSPTVYLNGTVLPLATVTSPTGTRTDDTSSDLLMGGNTATTSAYNGFIDDVMFYDRELTSTEVTNIYNYARCTGPAGIRGDIIYSSGSDVFQGCALNGWKAFHGP